MPFRTSQKDEEDLLPSYDNHFMAMSILLCTLLLTEFCVSLRDLREKEPYRSIATAFFTASTIRSISSLVL